MDAFSPQSTYVDPSWKQPSGKPGYLAALGRYMESLPSEIEQAQEDAAQDPIGTIGGVLGGALQSIPTPPSKYLKKLQDMDVGLSPQAQGGVALGEDVGKAVQSVALNQAIGGTGVLPNVLRAVGSEAPYMAGQSPEASGASILADMALGGLGYGLGQVGRSEGVQKGLERALVDETGAIGFPRDKVLRDILSKKSSIDDIKLSDEDALNLMNDDDYLLRNLAQKHFDPSHQFSIRYPTLLEEAMTRKRLFPKEFE